MRILSVKYTAIAVVGMRAFEMSEWEVRVGVGKGVLCGILWVWVVG